MENDVPSLPFDGPIPGENFTSDTRNYPWHRPPEYTDLDEAIEAAFKKLTAENEALGLLTMVEMGVDIATLTDMFVTSGIGAGKWTPDFAILMSGPVSHIIYLMAKGYGLDCEMGLENRSRPPTKPFFEAMQKLDPKRVKEAVAGVDPEEIKTPDEKPVKGFMGKSPLENEEGLV